MDTVKDKALEMAASARRDAEQASRSRLLAKAATYADDACKFQDNQTLRENTGPEECDRWAIIYRTVAEELRKTAGGGESAPRVWLTDEPMGTLTPDAAMVLDASLCIVLATPERRVTVGNVAQWIETLRNAKVMQQVRVAEAEEKRCS